MGWENDKQVQFRCPGNTVWGGQLWGLSWRCRWGLAGHGSVGVMAVGRDQVVFYGGHRRAGLCRRCEHWLGGWEEQE